MKIGIQGELGSFSHQAALRSIPDVNVVPCMLSGEAFDRLASGRVDAILIPVENTLAGSVVEHFDLLRERNVHVESETLVRIEHHVIGIADSDIESVQRIYSHPVALAQCRSFFAQHPGIEPIAFYDTAGAVKQIIELRDRHSAAIAGIQAADIYGGVILVAGVEDNAANYTRFLLVRDGPPGTPAPGPHKLSLCFELKHEPGALAGVLQAIATAGGNVTKFQSRPVQGRPWHYHFFAEVWVPDVAESERLEERLTTLCSKLRVLGRFPASAQFLEALA